MSAHDFQDKCACVMESILQSAIAETTKLFEAMVDEMKAEISRIKKENDDLKAKCSYFECAGNNPSEKRHAAVQCDIYFGNLLVEQCQPSLKNHQEIVYALQEHDYDVRGNDRIIVRHESVLRQDEVHFTHSSGDLLYAEEDSSRASQCETGSEQPVNTRESLKELPDLGLYHNLQGGQNQEVRPPENGQSSVLPCPTAGRASVNKQTGNNLQHHADMQYVPQDAAFGKGEACVVASSQLDFVGCSGPLPNSVQSMNSPQAPTLQIRKRHTSVTLQDARLLVEAMSSSGGKDVFSFHQGMAVDSACGPIAGALQNTDKALAELQILPHSFARPGAVHSLAAESSQETVNLTQPSETESNIRVSSAAILTTVQPLRQHGSSFLKATILPEDKMVPKKIMLIPRLAATLESRNPAAQSPTLVSAIATKDNAKAPDLPHGALTVSSVPFQRLYISPSMPLPVASTICKELPLGTKQHLTIKTVGPSQETALIQELHKSCERAISNLPSQEAKMCLDSPFAQDMEKSVIHKPCSKVQNECSQSCFSLSRAAGLKVPTTFHLKPSAVVRLTRLPIRMPDKESFLISTLSMNGGWDNHSALKQDTGHHENCASEELPCIGCTRPVYEESAIPLNNTGDSALTTVQPTEEKISSKDQEKDSASYTETRSWKSRRLWKNCFKVQLRNCIKPHLEVRSKTNQHAETQTVSYMKLQKDQQDSQLKMDMPEIVETSLRTTADCSPIPMRKSRLYHDVTKPALSKDKDPDYISSSSTAKSVFVVPRRCTSNHVRSSGEDNEKQSNSSGFCRRMITRGMSTGNDDTGDTQIKSTDVKKTRIVQADANPKNNLKVVKAKKLSKKPNPKRGKMKTSNQLLQNNAKIKWLEVNCPGNVAVKKIRSSGIWIPPVIETTEKALKQVSNKKETNSPRSLKKCVVHPLSVSLHPITVKAAPVVSPLQPLSLIGSRLLKNQCGACGQVLGSSAALESHVGLHTVQRPFSCRLCGKYFTDTKGLKRHGRVHRNGRIHACQKCGKGFVYRFSLTKHLQTVHGRIKPFVCQICNKGFFTKLDVESHIRIHTGEKPFHCNLCERKFIRRVDLNVHLRWHNGEKRHWCPHCGKGFLDFNNLKRHKYIHTGEKPYPCMHCPKHFTQSSHLKKHVKNVHKIAVGLQFSTRRTSVKRKTNKFKNKS